MIKADKRNLRVLVLLLAALGLTLLIGFYMNRRPNPVVVQAENQKATPIAPVQPTDARIRLDLLTRDNSDAEIGKKNLFQYGPPPAPPAPPKPPTPIAPPPIVQNPNPNQGRPISTTPPAPPPPPPITLKYIGITSVDPGSKRLIATLIDDQQRHFNAVEGDIYLGRYRVLKITDTAVEVEDLEFSRRQTLPLVKQ